MTSTIAEIQMCMLHVEINSSDFLLIRFTVEAGLTAIHLLYTTIDLDSSIDLVSGMAVASLPIGTQI